MKLRKEMLQKGTWLSPMIVVFCFLLNLQAEPSELEREQNRRIANQLLFYFDSERRIFTEEKLKDILEEEGTAAKRVFQRIQNDRDQKDQNVRYIKKTASKKKKRLAIFDSYEIRDAALKELLSLGEDGLDVLLVSIYSARDNIRQGVLKTLLNFNDERVLRVYDEVIFRDKNSSAKFSSLSKQYVALGVYQYLGSDHGKKIFHRCLQEDDPYVREAALKTLGKVNENYRPWVEKELLNLYDFEWSLVYKQVQRFKEREDSVFLKRGQEDQTRSIHQIIDDKPETLLYLANAMSALLSYAPKYMDQLKLTKQMIGHQMLGRLLVENNHVLGSELKQKVLKYYIRDHSDIPLQFKVLESLKAQDKKVYLKDLIWVVKHSKDMLILTKGIELASLWKVSELKPTLKKIAAEHYRRSIREKAEKALAGL